MKHFSIAVIVILCCNLFSHAQNTRKFKILFLGNSYTYVNNLPQMTADMATSTGDTLVFDSSAPGGQTLEGHTTNTVSLGKMAQGGWDYVVLQEQSQRPAFSDGQVMAEVYPYARKLDSLIRAGSPCAETVFYMTWGRQNGDAGNCAVWPPICTYAGMDSMLRARYIHMAEENDGILSPVGAVWRYLRTNHPTINLYSGDGSHPDVAGTYAAAACFYTVLYRKDPTLINHTAGLNAATATDIKNAVKTVVYNNLSQWYVGTYDPVANFTNTSSGTQVNFNNTSTQADTYSWNFGDGNTSNAASPQHFYTAAGTYTVRLVASKCGRSDTSEKIITTGPLGWEENNNGPFTISPNPAKDVLLIQSAENTGDVYNIRITDLTGKTVMQRTFTGKQSLDISALKNGMYHITVYRKNEMVFGKKIIKQ